MVRIGDTSHNDIRMALTLDWDLLKGFVSESWFNSFETRLNGHVRSKICTKKAFHEIV